MSSRRIFIENLSCKIISISFATQSQRNASIPFSILEGLDAVTESGALLSLKTSQARFMIGGCTSLDI